MKINSSISTNKTLRAVTARGVIALGISTITKYALQLIRMVILARLLAPSDFGIMGLGLIVIGGMEILVALGPDKYLIQKKELDANLIGTAWTLRMLLGLLIGLAAMAVAPIYAELSKETEVGNVLTIIALSSVVKGMKSPGAVLAERDLKFRKIAAFDIGLTMLELLVVVSLAMIFGNVLALAWGVVITAFVETLFSFWIFPIDFRPSWQRESLQELLKVGSSFVIISIGSFIMVQGDNLIVGTFLGTALLGQYIVAYRLCELPMQLTLQITGRAAYSAFCSVQTDIPRRTRWFLSMFELQLAMLIPAGLGIVVMANSIVFTIYGSGWEPAIPCLRALGLVVFGRGLSNLIAPFLIANGHYAFTARVKVIETVVFLMAVYYGVSGAGLVGAALGAGFGYFVAGMVRVHYLVQVVKIPATAIFKQIAVAILTVLPGAVGGLFCDVWLDALPPVRLVIGLTVLMVGYAVPIIFFRRNLLRVFLESLNSMKATPIPNEVNT